MKKFNSLFKAGETKVKVSGEYGFRTIKSVHDTRQRIEIDGLMGSFQRDDIIEFTNKNSVEMYPALDDLYTTDQYGSVYERGDTANIFIGKLNGQSLKKFVADLNN